MDSTDTCEKCTREPGHPHTFLYGKEESESEEIGASTRTTHTSMVKGRETGLIGDRCISDRRRYVLVRDVAAFVISATVAIATGAYFVVSLSSSLPGQPGEPAHFAAIMVAGLAALITLILTISIWGERRKSSDTIGEELSIKVHKRALKRKGFNGFWTQEEWADKPEYEFRDY